MFNYDEQIKRNNFLFSDINGNINLTTFYFLDRITFSNKNVQQSKGNY